MATVYMVPVGPLYQALTDAGAIGNGYKLYTYVGGTVSTLQTTYTDSTGTIANSNPIILGSNGRFQSVNVWVTTGVTLKLVLTDSTGAAITGGTIDNVPAINNVTATGVTYTSTGTGAVSRTTASKLGDIVSVKDFGATGDGITDDTTAIQAAITVGGRVVFPAGTYVVTNTLTIGADRVSLIGDGPQKTIIQFNPSTTKTCFDFTKGASSIYQCYVQGFGFSSSNSNNKTAINIRDGRHCVVTDIAISQGSWLGSGSVGLHTLGRDTLTASRLVMLCARPILIDVNPNYATLHCDHFHFSDLEIGSTETTGKAIEISSGVNISNLTFDGYNAWELGKYGIFWDDTSSSIDSYNLTIAGMRTEQATDATGYSIYLASTVRSLKALRIVEGYFESGRNGVYLRQPQTVTIEDSFFSGVAGCTNLNITFSSNTELRLCNTFVNTGSTVTLTNAVAMVEEPWIASNRACSSTAMWRYNEGALISQKSRRQDGVLGFRWKGSMTNVSQINLPILAASGAIVAHWRVAISGAAAHEAAQGSWKAGAVITAGATANIATASTGGKFAILDVGNGISLINQIGVTVTVVFEAIWAD